MQSIFDGIQVRNFFNLRVFVFLFSKKVNMNSFILYRGFLFEGSRFEIQRQLEVEPGFMVNLLVNGFTYITSLVWNFSENIFNVKTLIWILWSARSFRCFLMLTFQDQGMIRNDKERNLQARNSKNKQDIVRLDKIRIDCCI